MLGRKTMEAEILRYALEIAQAKKSISRIPLLPPYDNGSGYIEDATRTFAAPLGFIMCTTPVRRPESNVMAESSVKTFKRGYVYMNDLPDAVTVMEELTEWMEDYRAGSSTGAGSVQL